MWPVPSPLPPRPQGAAARGKIRRAPATGFAGIGSRDERNLSHLALPQFGEWGMVDHLIVNTCHALVGTFLLLLPTIATLRLDRWRQARREGSAATRIRVLP
jgi:hypothetical protein